jgi:iron complex transport system substrate-binding protein
MKRRSFTAGVVAAAAFAPFAAAGATRFTDDGGRRVALPPRITRVMPAGPPAAADLLMLAPEKLVGLTRALSPAEAAFLPLRAAALPGLGRLTGRGDTVNLEIVARMAPDLIVDLGYVSETFVSLAGRVQQRTGIPYVLIGGRLGDTPATWRKLGTVLGASARAEALARYADATLSLLRSRLAGLPPERRPSVYIARGPAGLETGVAGSINAEALDLVGARNPATAALGARGLATVSPEQLLAWQPDVIIVIDPGFFKRLPGDPVWQPLAAVKAKRTYLAPALPFGWIDEPPAANRLIGLRWLAKLLYSAFFPEDSRDEARHFYSLFYQRVPTDAQLDQLLARAI